MKYRITLPTKKELDLHKSCISVSFQNSKIIYTFIYKNLRPLGWITKNAIGKIIEAKPIKDKELDEYTEKIIKDYKHWFLSYNGKLNDEFPNIINKIFLKKIDNNLLENE